MKHYEGPDEYPIKDIPDIALWSENYAAMFSSPKEKAAVFFHAGRWHGDPSIWREVVVVSLPDDITLYHRGYSRASTATTVSGGLASFEIVEPGHRMKLRFDGPMAQTTLTQLIDHGSRVESNARCKIDLHFEGLAAVWDMKAGSGSAGSLAGGLHVEQVGRSSGTVMFGQREYSFENGFCVRDHSRGPRDVSHYGGHNWLNGVFPDGTGFHVYGIKVRDTDEPGMSMGAVIQGDRVMSATIRHTEYANSLADRGKPHRIILDCALGEMVIEITEVLNTVPISFVTPFDTSLGVVKHRWSSFLMDEAVRIRWNGQEGMGWSERGFVPEFTG